MKKKNLLVLGLALGILGGASEATAQTIVEERNTQEIVATVREWKVGTIENPELYNVNELVTYKGEKYKVLQTHENTGDETWNPADSPVLFVKESEETNISFDGKLSVALNKDNRTEVKFSIPRNSNQLNDSYSIEINGYYYFSVDKQVNYYCILAFIDSTNVYTRSDKELKVGDIVTLWYHSTPEAKKIQQIKVDETMLPR